jgi:hypothetical protein
MSQFTRPTGFRRVGGFDLPSSEQLVGRQARDVAAPVFEPGIVTVDAVGDAIAGATSAGLSVLRLGQVVRADRRAEEADAQAQAQRSARDAQTREREQADLTRQLQAQQRAMAATDAQINLPDILDKVHSGALAPQPGQDVRSFAASIARATAGGDDLPEAYREEYTRRVTIDIAGALVKTAQDGREKALSAQVSAQTNRLATATSADDAARALADIDALFARRPELAESAKAQAMMTAARSGRGEIVEAIGGSLGEAQSERQVMARDVLAASQRRAYDQRVESAREAVAGAVRSGMDVEFIGAAIEASDLRQEDKLALEQRVASLTREDRLARQREADTSGAQAKLGSALAAGPYAVRDVLDSGVAFGTVSFGKDETASAVLSSVRQRVYGSDQAFAQTALASPASTPAAAQQLTSYVQTLSGYGLIDPQMARVVALASPGQIDAATPQDLAAVNLFRQVQAVDTAYAQRLIGTLDAPTQEFIRRSAIAVTGSLGGTQTPQQAVLGVKAQMAAEATGAGAKRIDAAVEAFRQVVASELPVPTEVMVRLEAEARPMLAANGGNVQAAVGKIVSAAENYTVTIGSEGAFGINMAPGALRWATGFELLGGTKGRTIDLQTLATADGAARDLYRQSFNAIAQETLTALRRTEPGIGNAIADDEVSFRNVPGRPGLWMVIDSTTGAVLRDEPITAAQVAQTADALDRREAAAPATTQRIAEIEASLAELRARPPVDRGFLEPAERRNRQLDPTVRTINRLESELAKLKTRMTIQQARELARARSTPAGSNP